MVLSKIRTWHKIRKNRNTFSTGEREPFYDLIDQYLPPNPDALILDIGAGDGSFPDYLNLVSRYNRLALLDSNPQTVKRLRARFKNVIEYRIPGPIPFQDLSVDFIHCSHVVEHLYFEDLHKFLVEVNRVLSHDGIFVISSPLMWESFYNDPSHVKPYNPSVFIDYLTRSSSNRTTPQIEEGYEVMKLAHRYKNDLPSLVEGWYSTNALIDMLIQIMKILLIALKVKRSVRTGYTLVLKKN